MEKKNNNVVTIVICIVVFFIGCAAMYLLVSKNPSLFTKTVTELQKNVTVTDNGIADAVEKVYDSVVVVSTYKNNKLFSSGTGFAYKKEGNIVYILTNNHVISSGTKVTVTFTDGSVVETKIVGSDSLSDIAVLSVSDKEATSLANIGKSDDVRVGDTVFAVGAPLDSAYSWTVTRGIISGKDRMVEVDLGDETGEYVMKVLQTDAAINSGNSGGPLCNSNGEVIGITSLKLVDTSIEGIGFAIPIETAEEYAEKLIKGEIIQQPYLGVSMVNVTDAYYIRAYYSMLNKYNISSGVIINEVAKDSPAYKAGLQMGDVIIKLGDNKTPSIGYLRYYLYSYNIGDKATMTILRDGVEKTITITLGSSGTKY